MNVRGTTAKEINGNVSKLEVQMHQQEFPSTLDCSSYPLDIVDGRMVGLRISSQLLVDRRTAPEWHHRFRSNISHGSLVVEMIPQLCCEDT